MMNLPFELAFREILFTGNIYVVKINDLLGHMMMMIYMCMYKEKDIYYKFSCSRQFELVLGFFF